MTDSRMVTGAKKRGIVISSISRPLCKADIMRADVILGMDQKNLVAIDEAAQYWGCLNEAKQKTALLGEFRNGIGGECIVDPYWGKSQQFDRTLDSIEASIEGLLATLEAVNPHT
ncbi:putative low molecular weight [Cardiosporidium cionae]|uniref:Low molecular weight n=1 Tax=Cardiosporidium cionae TaxID=476202 RepID=A0ABQ7JAE8_9APIC|nr:putative low molecular weight [Cardiosporidium cionae]|eukprot:KAF8820988.1 putative low molecular weight [Cardiosporidium cionae]